MSKNIKLASIALQPSSDKLYEILKDDLLCLKLKPGQMISENDISKLYNVSRTPLRSVFSRLKNDKLIEVYPQRGSFVSLLDLDYIKNIIYMRYVLENDILSSIIDTIDDDFLAKIEVNLHKQKLIIQGPVNIKDFFNTDSQFHEIFYEFAGKKGLWSIIQDFQVSYTRFRMLDMVVTGRYDKLYKEHVMLYEILKNRRKAELAGEIKNHLFGNVERSKEYIINSKYTKYFKVQS